MKPPYTITPRILELVALISEKLGEVKSAYLHHTPTELRKRNRIHTIYSSLAIEGNTLSVEQITAVLEGKRVLAPAKDIIEVQNAIKVYGQIAEFKPYSVDSLCKAQGILMEGLVDHAGHLRNSSVGIVKGKQVTHIAPPHDLVAPHLKELMHYLRTDRDLMLIKSCVFHYEFEYIHPFVDGNGRMGRLWHTVLLRQYNSIFEFLPIETLIKSRQKEYYKSLEYADSIGQSTPFIEFMLQVIADSLEELLQSQRVNVTASDRINLFHTIIGNNRFARADYMRHFKDISTATASRDLKQAVSNSILSKEGYGRLSTYHFSERL